MTGSVEGSKAGKRQLVTFATGGELFAVDIFAVERVLRYVAPRRLPSTMGWLSGVIDHAGSAIPVIDLRERLGLPGTVPAESARILVVVVGESRIGVTVDEVLAVRTLEASAFEPPPEIYRGLAKEYLEGVVRHDGEIFVVLATAHLLTSTEQVEMGTLLTKESADG